MFWAIVIILVVLFLLLGLYLAKNVKKNNLELEKKGYHLGSKILVGKYIAGHPDLNSPLPGTILFPKDEGVDILHYPKGFEHEMPDIPTVGMTNILGVDIMPHTKGVKHEVPVLVANIPRDAMKNILAEDQSTVEKRVTVERLLLNEDFAFSWKKKARNEEAFLTIEWNDGRFDHETIFEFEGKDAMQKANTARNQLINIVRNPVQ